MILMNEFVSEQLWFTTAEIESMYFHEETQLIEDNTQPYFFLLSDATYRVVCGELFRIVDGTPPSLGKNK